MLRCFLYGKERGVIPVSGVKAMQGRDGSFMSRLLCCRRIVLSLWLTQFLSDPEYFLRFLRGLKHWLNSTRVCLNFPKLENF
jgi:hypothetical protein